MTDLKHFPPELLGNCLRSINEEKAKEEAIYQEALADFNAALTHHTKAEVESARVACGLYAARFACTYIKPEENQALYTRIYNIFWDYFHKEGKL